VGEHIESEIHEIDDEEDFDEDDENDDVYPDVDVYEEDLGNDLVTTQTQLSIDEYFNPIQVEEEINLALEVFCTLK